jgi:chain length determinant protein (polysaccharide antigen chain regulator)
MEEEISLREIIETILDGKWIIASVTALAILISGIASFFMIQPTYEASTTVMINSLGDTNSSVDAYLNEMVSPEIYAEQLKTPSLLRTVIEKEDLQDWSVTGFQNNLKVEVIKGETNKLVTLKMSGTDPEQIAQILNSLVEESKNFIATRIQEGLTNLTTQYEAQMEAEQEKLNEAVEEYNVLKAGSSLPALILFQQTTVGSQFILESNRELLEELRDLDKEKQVQFEKINSKISKLTSLYNSSYQKFEEARSVSSLGFVENKVAVMSTAIPPESPVSPKKMLNVAIAAVVGLMGSVFIVFLRAYWKESDPKRVNNQEVSM